MKRYELLCYVIVTLVLATSPTLAQTQPERKAGDGPGPIDSLQDLQDVGRMTFMMVDTNGDHLISRKEAINAGDLLVGGSFFRADRNGDSVLTQDEVRQAREEYLTRKPWLRYVVETVRTTSKPIARQADAAGQPATTGVQDPLAMLESAFDTNNDKQLQSTELRQAVQSSVQGLFATADTNRDDQLSQSELNASMAGLARTVADAAFRGADTDNNGQTSQAEWETALIGPSRVVFHVADLNNDGQISRQEAETLRQVVSSKLQNSVLPEAPNSPRNAINSALGNQTAPARPVATPSIPR